MNNQPKFLCLNPQNLDWTNPLHTHPSSGLPYGFGQTLGERSSANDYGIAPMKNYFNIVVSNNFIYFYGHPSSIKFAVNFNNTFKTNPPADVWSQ